MGWSIIRKGAAVVTVVTVVATAGEVYAQAAAADDKFKNGVPFKELAAEIEANREAISVLQVTTDELGAQVAALDFEVANLSVQVAANTAAIDVLDGEAAALRDQLTASLMEMADLSQQLESLSADVEANASAIASTESAIGDLELSLRADIQALDALLAGLRADLEVEKGALDALHAQVEAQDEAVQNHIAAIWGEISRLQVEAETAGTLVAQVVANRDRLDLLQQIVDANAAMMATRAELDELRQQYLSHRHRYDDYYRDINNVGQNLSRYTDGPSQ